MKYYYETLHHFLLVRERRDIAFLSALAREIGYRASLNLHRILEFCQAKILSEGDRPWQDWTASEDQHKLSHSTLALEWGAPWFSAMLTQLKGTFLCHCYHQNLHHSLHRWGKESEEVSPFWYVSQNILECALCLKLLVPSHDTQWNTGMGSKFPSFRVWKEEVECQQNVVFPGSHWFSYYGPSFATASVTRWEAEY